MIDRSTPGREILYFPSGVLLSFDGPATTGMETGVATGADTEGLTVTLAEPLLLELCCCPYESLLFP